MKHPAVFIVPVFRAEAKEFVGNFHRHNKRFVGDIFCIGASDGRELVGVAVVGRPTAWPAQDGETVEVRRCCVRDAAPKGTNGALYAACWRAAKALGWRRLITYTLQSESGASLRGAGFRVVAELAPRDPKGWQSRPGREWQPVVGQSKFRWERAA